MVFYPDTTMAMRNVSATAISKVLELPIGEEILQCLIALSETQGTPHLYYRLEKTLADIAIAYEEDIARQCMEW